MMQHPTRALFVALLAGCAAGAAPGAEASDDYAVYSSVIRDVLLQRSTGEHTLVCEDASVAPRAVVDRLTLRLWPRSAREDSAAAAELPEAAAPLFASLRTLDSLPRTLMLDSLTVGAPIELQPDSVGAPRGRVPNDTVPLIRLSRVAYSRDGRWALAYASKACREKPVGEVEEGSFGFAVLAPLERRGAAWTVVNPVYLHLD